MLSENSRKRLMSAYDRMVGKKTKDMSEIDALTKEFKENEPDAFHVDITKVGQKIGTLDDRVFFDRPVGFLFGNPGFINHQVAKFSAMEITH